MASALSTILSLCTFVTLLFATWHQEIDSARTTSDRKILSQGFDPELFATDTIDPLIAKLTSSAPNSMQSTADYETYLEEYQKTAQKFGQSTSDFSDEVEANDCPPGLVGREEPSFRYLVESPTQQRQQHQFQTSSLPTSYEVIIEADYMLNHHTSKLQRDIRITPPGNYARPPCMADKDSIMRHTSVSNERRTQASLIRRTKSEFLRHVIYPFMRANANQPSIRRRNDDVVDLSIISTHCGHPCTGESFKLTYKLTLYHK